MSSEGPDPLGKRALFWAPAERVEDQIRPGEEEPEDVGKYALFSHFSDSIDEEQPDPGLPAFGRGGALIPPVHLHCSSCGARSEVDVMGYFALHVPFFLWRPGRGFTRFMICPACRRRTWLSASWTPWPTR